MPAADPHAGSLVAPVVTLSGGATTVPEERLSSATLVATADVALYQAKREGRNRVVAVKA